MRSTVLIAVLALFVAACSDEASGVVDGPADEDVADERPYGPGAEVGETYEYVLYVHCGVRWARLDGVWWETKPLDDDSANPPDGWGNPYDAGTMTLVDDHTAEYAGGPGTTVRFERTELSEVPFECE